MPRGLQRDLSTKTSKCSEEALRRAFSVQPHVLSSSSFIEDLGNVKSGAADEQSEYRIIGLGSCGSVFGILRTDFAVKKGRDINAMWNDFNLTNTVHNAMADTRELLQDVFPKVTLPRIPQCIEFLLPESKDYWKEALPRFPTSHREKGAVFQVDLIRPLSQIVREALKDLYFEDSEDIRQEARNDQENEHCLVRVYLGERETADQESTSHNSLRNFPMRLNMIEDLGLEKFALATEMAIALAIIHWRAQVDAMDVEYVLGSASEMGPERRRAYTIEDSDFNDYSGPHQVRNLQLNFKTRSIHMWVLDFDKAASFALTTNDVEKRLVPAFLGNDPYYPRPDVDEALWKSFSKTYLMASRIILVSRHERYSLMSLPKLFLDKVVDMIKEHEGWNPEDHIVFG
ncbi:hypothetical protein MMC17_007158 [Xylographa soralifera]|nr:hypothetical protein [Xylographa soralifera]